MTFFFLNLISHLLVIFFFLQKFLEGNLIFFFFKILFIFTSLSFKISNKLCLQDKVVFIKLGDLSQNLSNREMIQKRIWNWDISVSGLLNTKNNAHYSIRYSMSTLQNSSKSKLTKLCRNYTKIFISNPVEILREDFEVVATDTNHVLLLPMPKKIRICEDKIKSV